MSQKLYQSEALTDVGCGTPNVPAGAIVSVVEEGNQFSHKTTVTFSNFPITVGNTTGVSFGGTKLYDFPLGRLLIKGSVLKDVVVGLGSPLNLTPIAAGDGGDISMGSTVAGDGTLTNADVDLIPSTSIDPMSGGLTRAALAAAAAFDGSTTAIDAYINMLIDDADVEDEASDVLLLSGVWVCTWDNLG